MNLTPLLLMWTVFWGSLAVIVGSWTYFFIALTPWAVLVALVLLAVGMFYRLWMVGEPVSVTFNNTRRTFHRGRPTTIERV